MIIADIENGMINRVAAASASGALGYKLKKIESYGGEFSEAIDNLIRDFPAMLFIFLGATPLTRTNMRVKFAARWGVIIGAHNLRSEVHARQGHDDKPGSYKLFLDAIMLLSNQTFGLEIDPLKAESINPLFNNKVDKKLASIYTVEFSTTFEIELGEEADGLDDFTTFHANWDIPPHGNVEPPLPADDQADATDTVTLENT